MCYMKTATVRDLRNHYTEVLRWIDAGEDVLITKRGKVFARLSPESDEAVRKVDWKGSPEVIRNRNVEVCISSDDSAAILKEASGRW